jgi:hypothetical protein
MRSRDLICGAIVAGVAALSFAVGRIAAKPSSSSVASRHDSLADHGENDSPPPLSIPPQLPNIVTMPFRDSYTLFKTAPEETLRSYFAELREKRPKPTRQAGLVSFFKTLIHVNPSLTFELISQLKKDDRWVAMFAIRDVSPPRGMRAVVDVLLGFDREAITGHSWDLLAETVDEWARNDPIAVKDFLDTHRDRKMDSCFPKLIRNWAAYDPEAAQRWMTETVQNHRPPAPDDESIGDGWRATIGAMQVAWLEGFLQNDPDAAVDYIVEHVADPGVRDPEAIGAVAGDLFEMSPDRTRDFLNRLPEEEKLAALYGVAAKSNPFVLNSDPDNTTSPRFIAEWMFRFFPDRWPDSFRGLLGDWSYANAQELFSWMANLPPTTREAVISKYPTYVSDKKPSEDFDLIMQAPDPAVRDGLLETLARNAASNGKLLLGVLEKSALPPSQKAYLASLIPPEPSYDSENSDGN